MLKITVVAIGTNVSSVPTSKKPALRRHLRLNVEWNKWSSPFLCRASADVDYCGIGISSEVSCCQIPYWFKSNCIHPVIKISMNKSVECQKVFGNHSNWGKHSVKFHKVFLSSNFKCICTECDIRFNMHTICIIVPKHIVCY